MDQIIGPYTFYKNLSAWDASVASNDSLTSKRKERSEAADPEGNSTLAT